MIGKIKGQDSNLYLKKIINEIVKDKEIPSFAKQYIHYKN